MILLPAHQVLVYMKQLSIAEEHRRQREVEEQRGERVGETAADHELIISKMQRCLSVNRIIAAGRTQKHSDKNT